MHGLRFMYIDMPGRQVFRDEHQESDSGPAEGKGKEAVAMMKNCMLCGKCSMVCPRGINTRHLILSICRIYEEERK